MKSYEQSSFLTSLSAFSKNIFCSYSEILFIKNAWIGLIILVCSFQDYNMGTSALFAILSLLLFSELCGMRKALMETPYFIYNTILVGLSIGYIFRFGPRLILFIFIATILTFLLTNLLHHFFINYGLPILSLPFAVISTAIYMTSDKYSSLFSLALYDRDFFVNVDSYLPFFLKSFFSSLGAIFFMPNAASGILIFIALLICSRVMAFQAIIGFTVGVFVHSLFISSLYDSLLNAFNFNFILVSIAIGGVFLLPTPRSYLISMIAVGVSVLLVDISSSFAEVYRIPVFTLPFNVTVVLFVMTMRVFKFSDFNYAIRRTPEESLANSLMLKKRFVNREISIGIPIAEICSIYQGQDDIWTHKGLYKYAIDLVIRDKAGNMYKGEGAELENYYIYDHDVISPVTGYVVECNDMIYDNPLSHVDHKNNWGNYIIIRSLDGVFVEISHLKQHSLTVSHGNYVVLGQVIGKCGNSGFSPLPHLHVQVQKSSSLGDETLPFNFTGYSIDDKVYFYSKPVKDDTITPLVYDTQLAGASVFPLGAVYEYDIYSGDDRIDSLVVTMSNDYLGNSFFEDGKGNRIYFAYRDYSCYFYDYYGGESYLLKIYSALPRLPFIVNENYNWNEVLPFYTICSKMKSNLYYFFASFYPSMKLPCGNWKTQGNEVIEGELSLGSRQVKTSVSLKKGFGIKEVKVDKLIIKLKE